MAYPATTVTQRTNLTHRDGYDEGLPAPGTAAHAREVNRLLAAEHPDARCALDHRSPYELLIATVLSAQTSDERVNSVTPALFDRWPGPRELAAADPAEVEGVLRPLGFFRAKARSLLGIAAALRDRMGATAADAGPGVHDEGADPVPHTLQELVRLPGVGRKTANVVLGNAYGIPGIPGITVDTHVGRLARRLGMTDHDDPVKVEKDLGRLVPPEDWTMFCHRLIFHGRRVCHARRPDCGACVLAGLCPSARPAD